MSYGNVIPALLGQVILLAALMPTAADSYTSSVECEGHGLAPAVHLAPGERREQSVTVEFFVPDEVAASLPPYRWRVEGHELVSVNPQRGDVRFERSGRDPTGTRLRFTAEVQLSITAGSGPGSEIVPITVFSADPGETPRPCRAFELTVPVTVGGDWGVYTRAMLAGRMTVTGALTGTFSIVDGNRVQGRGTSRTLVSGTCTHGVSEGPFLVDGTVEGQMVRFTILEDWDHEPEEADVQIEESMECAIVSLREIPSAIRMLAEWAVSGVLSDPCPLEMPVDATHFVASCGGLEYVVRRVGP